MSKFLIWIDVETTSLDPEKGSILEIAAVVTDQSLTVVAGKNVIVHTDDDVLKHMDEWCIEQHEKSGLSAACRESKTSLSDAAQEILSFITEHCKEAPPMLCGLNTGFDRAFIARNMPELLKVLHYGDIDVLAVRRLRRLWYPSVPPYPSFQNHRALGDIHHSISELCYYRAAIFRQDSSRGLG